MYFYEKQQLMCGFNMPTHCEAQRSVEFPIIREFLKEIIGNTTLYEVNYVQSDPPEVTQSGIIRSSMTVSFNMPDFIFYKEIPPFVRQKFETIYELWLHNQISEAYLKKHGIDPFRNKHLVKKRKWNKIANSKNWFLIFEGLRLEFESRQSIKEMAYLNSFTKTKLGWTRKNQLFQKEYIFTFTSETDLKNHIRTALFDKIR